MAKKVLPGRGALVRRTGATSPSGLSTGSKTKARSKKIKNPWEDMDVNRDIMTEGYLDAITGSISKLTGRTDIVCADEAERIIITIPFPHLSLQYLFCNTGFAMPRMWHIFGPPGTLKSTFAAELLRWHLEYYGLGVVIENEQKDIADLRNAILRKQTFMKRTRVHPTNSMLEWQAALTYWMRETKDQAFGTKEMPGPGSTIPCCYIVDSVMGTATEGELQKIDASGAAGRGDFGTGANYLTNYCKALAKHMMDFPFTAVFVNHQKMKKDAQGRPAPTTPGGWCLNFHASYELEMRRIKHLKLASSGGVALSLRTKKNALGEADRRISASVLWAWRKDDMGKWHYDVYWDWHTATTEMLLARKKDAGTWKKINEVVDIRIATGRRIWSKKLRIAQDAAVSFHEFGKRLEARRDLVTELWPLLGIHVRRIFVPGMDFTQQQEQAKAEGEQIMDELHEDIEIPDDVLELNDAMAAEQEAIAADDDQPNVNSNGRRVLQSRRQLAEQQVDDQELMGRR